MYKRRAKPTLLRRSAVVLFILPLLATLPACGTETSAGVNILPDAANTPSASDTVQTPTGDTSVEPTAAEDSFDNDEPTVESANGESAGSITIYLPVSETTETAVVNFTYDDSTRTLVGVETAANGESYTSSSIIYNEYGEKVDETWYNDDGSFSHYSYVYDENGYVIESATHISSKYYISEHSETYSYDEFGNVTEEIYYDSSGKILDIYQYLYNESGQMTKTVCYNDDGSVSRTCDYVYDESGNQTSLVWVSYYGDNNTFRYEYKYDNTYNENGYITERILYVSDGTDGTICGRESYGYDADGNLIAYCCLEYDESGAVGSNESYTYDGDGNLLEEYHCQDGGDSKYRASYTYDTYGNVIEKVYFDADNADGLLIRCVWQAVTFKSR